MPKNIGLMCAATFVVVLSLACGGGGGGGSSSGSTTMVSSSSPSGFYSIRMKSGSALSSFDIVKSYSSEIDISNLTLKKSGGNIVLASTAGSSTELDRLLIAIDGGQPTGGKLTGDWLGGIYGKKSNTNVDGLCIELSFDSAGNASFAKHASSTSFSTFDGILPGETSGDISITNGKINWGNWEGMSSGDGTKLLMAHKTEDVFLLAAKTGSYPALTAGSYSGSFVYHENGTNITSNTTTLTVGATTVTGVVGGSNYTWNSVTYASGNSYIGLNNNNTPPGVEPGFRANSEFFVIVNPSANNPFFLVAPLP